MQEREAVGELADADGLDGRGQEPDLVPDLVLLGGVFDPVHRGHLQLAECARDHLAAPRVALLPSGQPPHKSNDRLTPAEHRLRMLQLAVEGRGGLTVDAREIHRPGPSYTVLTLEELHRERDGRRVYFLIGADNVPYVGRWHQAERIFELCDPVIVPRAGSPARFVADDVPFLSAERIKALNALVLPFPEVSVSSSEIRDRAGRGLAVSEWVPAAVEEYIRTHDLYGTQS